MDGTIILGDKRVPAAGANVVLRRPLHPPTPLKDTAEIIVTDESRELELRATTNASGFFAITNIRPGEYYVSPYFAGYISGQDYIYPGAFAQEFQGTGRVLPRFIQKVVISAGSSAHVELQLERGGAIEGTVASGVGPQTPLEDVALGLCVKGQDGEFRRVLGASHADNNGHYRFDAVPAGSYMVFGALPGGMVPTIRGSQGSTGPIFFYGDSSRPSKFGIVEVIGRATQADINLTIPTVGLHMVQGKVETPDGRPITKGIVRLYPAGEKVVSRANPVEADGTFHFDRVESGAYTLSVEDPPDFEMVGFTPDAKGMRMRNKPRLYSFFTRDISVVNDEPMSVVVRLIALP